ncbi:insulinase family protein [Chryseobacterium indologenes]|uniref:M16 family metallopeptidase n=1 Tax=Chryseobacterium indologenes TaxID=253 RepID=UPI000B519610|nr:insulinase family protein [Chryseobacterium indologenes]ASE60876.1 insulinase family protein [Chryseobacterium indologenes]AYZ36038.1 insulinase family protein [Chryseobacterium indologenes]MBF6644825.1 insulinase family protein [Chryseobacterium indologenes]MBU3047597.1 insulinase family protein [Chryseobacterium indologenes]MEB4760659.1 insulinase family protein [Chryseobacterium indologenes]
MNLLKKLTIATSIAAASFIGHAHGQDFQWKEATANGYKYKYVTNDPTSARYYTLKNGLTVILSPTNKDPRIQTYIATKAGSKTDPADHTGLAHYLEHMLFKGTNQFGSKDWAKEKPLLDQIDALYEKYNQTKDENKRKEIYKEIDKVSGEAAKYAIANEYDKMLSGMGADGTNAFTSFEQTVYTEDIPANVTDKFLAVQAERFREPVLRLFHTELEAVYEEKNRGLDNDPRKVYEAMFAAIFPNNNYGKQTTIGTVEHLKNPSLKAIREYFNNYYVPNNMGIIMSGDFNPDEMIAKIDKAFSYMKPKAIPAYNVGQENAITSPVTKEVYGPTPENITIGFRFPGATTKDARLLNLVGSMLTNGQAGLIDLDLVKKQKLLAAYAFPYVLKDYSVLLLQGNPTEGQSLDQVKTLLLQEIDKLRKGDFSDDLIQSIVNNERKKIIQDNEKYSSRAGILMDEFTSEVDHKTNLEYVEEISKLTKKDIMDFASKYLKDNNYVAVYKRKGEDKSIVKVDKPTITPVSVNREDQSSFLKKIDEMPENPISPVWLNYDKDIAKNKLGDVDVLSVKNTDNALFRMYYYFDSGKWNNKMLPLATEYLQYLGTKDKSSEIISKEFYKLASSFNVSAGNEETYVSLEGLNENFDKTISLFEDLIKNCQADQAALDAYKARIKKSRANAKQNKGSIMAGLRSYAQYGPQNPFNNVLSDAELDALKAEDLVNILHDLFNFKHKVLYYGPKTGNDVTAALKPIHKLPATLKELPKTKTFTQIPTDKNKVLFAHYDMVQAEVFWVRNSDPYNAGITPTVSLFNNYFGGGMGSIVFQTIRESKALAYSTYSYFALPSKKTDKDMIMAYVGTQADKFNESTAAMNELLTTLPKSEQLFETAKSGLKKSIAAERITQDGIIFSYLKSQKLGNDFDIRKNVYEQAPKLSFAEINTFHEKEMKNKNFTYCVVAAQDKVNEADIQKLGEVKKLNLTEIFGY